jgi:hypothetical protein
MKDMKNMVRDAPVRLEQAQQMAANAQTLSAAYQAQAASQVHGTPLVAGGASASALATASTGPDFEPIAAVSLELYARISKSLATIDYDLSQSVRLAGDQGVSEENWAVAVEGWNARMAANPAVGTKFSALYAAS